MQGQDHAYQYRAGHGKYLSIKSNIRKVIDVNVISFLIQHWKGFLILIIAVTILIFFARKALLRNARMRRIDKMSGPEFELYLYEQFRRMKCYKKVRHVGQSGDYGADLILYKKDGRKIIVQAKRYHGCVGIAAVQQAIGAMNYYDADEGIVATNSTFSDAAKNLASTSNVKLYDRNFIYKLANKKVNTKEIDPEEESGQEVIGITLHYKRIIQPPEGVGFTSKALENKIDEYLINMGCHVKRPDR